MNKERKEINEQNAIVVFEGDVYAARLNELFQDFQGDIVINGNLIVGKGGLNIECDNLYVVKSLEISGLEEDDIWLDGNLYAGQIDCRYIDVNGSIYCMGFIDSLEVNVTEDLYAKSYISTNCCNINVGGELICEDEIEGSEITVLNKMCVSGKVQADKISVG